MKSKKIGQFIKNNYTVKQKRNIAKKILDLTEKDIEIDFANLQNIGCEKKKALSQIGNDTVNYFTFVERLNTIGNKKLNFYDVWRNKNALAKKNTSTTCFLSTKIEKRNIQRQRFGFAFLIYTFRLYLYLNHKLQWIYIAYIMLLLF